MGWSEGRGGCDGGMSNGLTGRNVKGSRAWHESGLFLLPDIQSPPTAAQEAKSVEPGHALR